jgi:hypothetical protein
MRGSDDRQDAIGTGELTWIEGGGQNGAQRAPPINSAVPVASSRYLGANSADRSSRARPSKYTRSTFREREITVMISHTRHCDVQPGNVALGSFVTLIQNQTTNRQPPQTLAPTHVRGTYLGHGATTSLKEIELAHPYICRFTSLSVAISTSLVR